MSISLEHIIGFRVKITNLLDVITEGKIYSFNTSNNTITLQTSRKNQSPYSFKIIKCSFVKRLELIGEKPTANSFKRQYIKPSHVSIARVEELLNEKIAGHNTKPGNAIPPEGHIIFDLLHKTIPDVKWQGKNIILGDIKIRPPYKVENMVCKNGSSKQSLAIVERIIERSWNQMEEDDGRKGG